MPYRSVAEGGPTLFYTDEGSGRPVLLIHGLGCDGSDWAWLAAGLSRDHRTVVMDTRGQGRSSPVPGRYDIDSLAADCLALIEQLGLDRPVVVAHSMGALPAVRLAAEHGDTIGGLVLIDPALGRADDDAERVAALVTEAPHEAMLRVFAGFHVQATPEWMRWWHLRRVMGTTEDVIVNTVRGAWLGPRALGRRSAGTAELPKITVPRLVLYAGNNTERYQWDLGVPHPADDEIELWPDNGHFLHQEAPERFESRLRSWLTSRGLD
ncbi:MAG TPA: alpha/beta hydrolase [Trebonia sp.]